MHDNEQIKLVLHSAPATEPVTLSEAKSHLRIDDTSEDTLITALISAARQVCENITRRAFVTQTYRLYINNFPFSRRIVLPRAKLQSVTHIKYYDVNGNLQTLSDTNYYVDTYSEPGEVYLKDEFTWPIVQSGRINAVEIEYVVGYGVAANVPEAIKSAIKIYIAHLFEHREPIITGTSQSNVPMSVEYILMPYRVLRFF